jgi:hypothetical protein
LPTQLAAARMSSKLYVGSRVTFISCQPSLCPTIGQKQALWHAPIENRGGIVVARQLFLDVHHYIIILDEPLNEDCWDIDETVAELYVADYIPNPKKHVLLVPINSYFEEEIVFDVNERYDRGDEGRERHREYVQMNQHKLGMCQRCHKAQLNRNLLFTCRDYNHTMCKRCLVEWDEKSNRADMSRCEQYTFEMKQYCRNILTFEPTFLPTRVLLGFYYWCTEHKEKAVEEFCEYDYWVCWVCRFADPSLRRNSHTKKGEKCTEKFDFIHEQLFPFGSDIEAPQILDNNERDLFARFGASIASPLAVCNENAMKLKEDIIINVYLPELCRIHRVHCLANWTIAQIYNKILEETNTHYDVDLVIYTLDENGWEVELCDLSESNSKVVSGGVVIMSSIQDLQNDDYLVVRMRTKQMIGARSHLQILGVLEPKFFDDVQHICKSYDGFRRIGGDGNCYYRAVAFGLIEQFILFNTHDKFQNLYDIFETIVYPENSQEKKAHDELLYMVIEASQGNIWMNTEELQRSFLDPSSHIDEALVRACRSLLATYLITNKEKVMENGLSLSLCILCAYEDVQNMEDYCDKYVRQMGEDAEGAYLQLGILPSLLRTSCVIHNLDIHAINSNIDQREIECPYTVINGSCLGSVHILLRPGHYDLLYSLGVEFSRPLSAPITTTHTAIAPKSKDYYKPLDLLTGDDKEQQTPETSMSYTDTKSSYSLTETREALSDLLELCPNMDREFAKKLLQKYEYNVGNAANDYFANQEIYSSFSSSVSPLLDLDAESKCGNHNNILPQQKYTTSTDHLVSNARIKDKIFEQLRREMPDVTIQDLHDAVHLGNADNVSSVHSYIERLADNRYYDNK